MYSPQQIRRILELMADDEFYFAQTVAPQYFNKEFAVFHRHMLRKINNPGKDKTIVVIEVPRGFGKTMIASTLNPLHRAIFPTHENKRLKFILIASFSTTRTKLIIGDYRKIIMGENFQGIFPGTVLNKDTADMIEVENKEYGFHFMVMARGRESQVAGMRFEEARPQLFIADDLENPDEAYNQDIVDANERFINEVVQYGLAKDGYSILIGTPFAFDCFTERFAKYEQGVQVIKYPALVETEEMAKELGLKIGQSIWEDMYSTKELEDERDREFANNNIDEWMRQRQLNPASSSQVRFNMSKIKRVNNMDEIRGTKLNVFILSDFAYSKHIYADDSAIIVFGVDDQANYYIMHSDKGKWGDIGTTERIIDQVRMCHKDLRLVGVETRGFGFVERRMADVKRQENLSFGVIELKPENRGKAERIKAMISIVEDGRIIFVGKHQKLEMELASFRGEEVKHGDDLRDAFAYIRDVAFKPTTQKTIAERQKEEQHQAFMRFSAEIDRSKEKSRTVRSVYGNDSYY